MSMLQSKLYLPLCLLYWNKGFFNVSQSHDSFYCMRCALRTVYKRGYEQNLNCKNMLRKYIAWMFFPPSSTKPPDTLPHLHWFSFCSSFSHSFNITASILSLFPYISHLPFSHYLSLILNPKCIGSHMCPNWVRSACTCTWWIRDESRHGAWPLLLKHTQRMSKTPKKLLEI